MLDDMRILERETDKPCSCLCLVPRFPGCNEDDMGRRAWVSLDGGKGLGVLQDSEAPLTAPA